MTQTFVSLLRHPTSRRVALFLIATCAIPALATGLFDAQKAGTGGAVVQTEQVRAELVAQAPDGVAPGKTVWVGLQLAHQPHWHTYWKNPGDSGLPTQLQWTLPEGVQAGDIAWPTPRRIAIGNLANLGYEGTVLLPVPLTITPAFHPSALARELDIRLAATWLVCRQECIPQEGNFVLRLPLQGSTALHQADFAAAQGSAPQPHRGSARAQVDGQALTLRVAGLPAAWQGQALNAYAESPEVLETAALPAATDAVRTGAAAQAGTQGWQDGVWTARLPLSGQRSSSPTTLPVVLALGAQSLQVQADVAGTWPALAARATVSPALQVALDSNRALQGPATAPQGGWLWSLAAALLGGLILNLMPCVFPVLAIKVLGFATPGAQASRRGQGLAYTAGVVLSFMALGALMLGLRAGGEQLGWGFQLQSPAVIATLALLFTLLAMNLAGWLEVGHLLPSGLASLQLRHPLGDAFLSGVLAVAIASPCTAPFMGASLGYAITLPATQALGIFAALGLGLAAPYLAASWLPALGRWMPRPGAWMEHLRHFMAFPMAATVVWLLWVLGHLSGINGTASLLALLLALAMLVWALGLSGRSRTVFTIISIAACALLVLATGPNIFKMEAPGPVTAGSEAGNPWQAWAPGRVQAELATGKPVFVDFTAAWCITCQVNKATTLGHADVLADFATHQVTLLRADWTRRDPAITEALTALGRSGVPVYVLYQNGRAPVVLSEILSVQELRSALSTL